MKKSSGILKQTTGVLLLTLFIKVLGFGKQALLAAIYGATVETDALYISSGIINSLCSLFFSAIAISLLSMYAKRLAEAGKKSANQLINQTLFTFLPLAVLITVVFFFAAPLAAKVFAPSYTGREYTLLVSNIKALSICFVLSCYYLILNVVAEANKDFLSGKGYSFFQNLFVILAACAFTDIQDAKYLVYAFVLAGIVQCVWITIRVRKFYKPNLKNRSGKEYTMHLISLMVPLLIGNAIYEINDIVDKQITSGLGNGAVSILTYGASVNEIVTTVIIASVSTVLFSHFATWAAQGKIAEIESHLELSNDCLAFITVPASLICIAAGEEIVSILFGRGNFTYDSVLLTCGVTAGYACGFLFQAMRANFVKAFYAFGDTRRPMINGVVSVACNICLSIFLSRYIGIAGVALATSIAMLIATLLLGHQLKIYLPHYRYFKNKAELFKVLFASATGWAGLYLVKNLLQVNTFLLLIVEALVFGTLYIAVMFALKSSTLQFVLNKVKKR